MTKKDKQTFLKAVGLGPFNFNLTDRIIDRCREWSKASGHGGKIRKSIALTIAQHQAESLVDELKDLIAAMESAADAADDG